MVDVSGNLPPQTDGGDSEPGVINDNMFGRFIGRPTLLPEIIGGLAATGADPEVKVLGEDPRTGRRIIQSGTNPDTGLPNGRFEPVRIANVIIPYDQ